MFKQNVSRVGAIGFLIVGIAIGFIASQTGFSGAEPASAEISDSVTSEPSNSIATMKSETQEQDREAPDLSQEPRIGGFPASMQPWRVLGDPLTMKLDPGWDMYFKRRDTSNDPDREAGPIDLQRYAAVSGINGFPTYMGLPVALTTDDLKAGEVDVAIVGLPSWFQPTGGTQWAANHLRLIRSYDHANVGHDMHLNIDYFKELNVVDYGNANQNPTLMVHNFADQALVLKEILEADAMPMVIGGDHGTQVASIMALVDKYGPQNFAVVHFDAHFDLEDDEKTFGVFTHGARARRYAFDQGWLAGEDIIDIGIRSPYHSSKLMKWRKETVGGPRYYMTDFEKYGFEATWNKIKKDLKGKKLYISVDIDILDPAYVPGTSNPEPGGLTAIDMLTMLRGLCIQNEVILVDFVEYTPLLDDRHYNTGLLVNRLMRVCLAGIAGRKTGITDPDYIAPESLNREE